MIDHMMLIDVRSQTYRLCPGKIDVEKGKYSFVYFGTIHDTASRKKNTDFFHINENTVSLIDKIRDNVRCNVIENKSPEQQNQQPDIHIIDLFVNVQSLPMLSKQEDSGQHDTIGLTVDHPPFFFDFYLPKCTF